jgi:hypothetical protein
MGVDMHLVGVDAHQQLGRAIGGVREAGFEPYGQQQERMAPRVQRRRRPRVVRAAARDQRAKIDQCFGHGAGFRSSTGTGIVIRAGSWRSRCASAADVGSGAGA